MNLPSAAARCQPRFVVGITGHMHFDRTHDSTIRQRIRTVLQWLTGDALQNDTCGRVLFQTLGPSPTIEPASVLLLTCLAPGVDQIAADVALELGIAVRGVLPFPESLPEGIDVDRGQVAPIYRHASTFRRGDGGDELRIADYNSRVRQIGVENLFVVRQDSDAECSDQQWVDQLRRDLSDPAGRRRRYRAAGDSVADLCQLLIAVCDRETLPNSRAANGGMGLDALESVACADVVIDTHLQGVSPRRLAEPRATVWGSRRTVLRIFLPRSGVADRDALRAGDVAVWSNEDWSIAPRSGDAGARGGSATGTAIPRTVTAVASEHAAGLRREAQHLAQLQRRFRAMADLDAAAEARRLLPRKSPPAFTASCLLQQQWKRWSGWLTAGIRRLQKSGAQERLPAAPETKLQALAGLRRCASRINLAADTKMKTLRGTLLWLALAVMVLLQLSQYWVPAQMTGNELSVVNSRRLWLFVASGLGFGFSWLLYLQSRRQRLNDDQDDHRVLTEALRVQFYWTAAGTGKLVSQHYLQHQRGGLTWILAAINSSAMPVSEDRVDFLKLNRGAQRQRLEEVRSGWLEEQAYYFEKKAYELTVRQRWQTFYAQVLLISGLLQLAIACVLEYTSREEWFSQMQRDYWLQPLGLLTISGLLSFLLVQLLTWQAGRQGYPATSNSAAAGWLTRINHAVDHPGSFFVAALLLSGVLLAAAYGVPETLSQLPSGRGLNQIFRNVCFAGAGLLHAAMSFSFLSRNIAYYISMGDVFRRSARQMATLLEALPDDDVGRDQRLQQIRQLLVAVGIEALNENSDWLQRHRAAPVAPIMPSG